MEWARIIDDSISFGIGPFGVIAALAAIGLNIQFGYTGLLNFGQAGFMAMGAYGMAISVTYFDAPLLVGIVVGVMAAVGLALILGVPTLRLRGDYLAIVTIAAGEIIRFLVQATNFRGVTGGADGLQGFAHSFQDANPIPDGVYGFWRLTFSENTVWEMAVGWSLVALFCVLTYLLMRSPWGRVVKGIREDEDAVRSLGKNVYAYKMQSLVMGGVIGASAGIMLALAQASATPANFQPIETFIAYTALILGGTARVLGPVIGAILFRSIFQFAIVFLGEANDSFIPKSIIGDNDTGAVALMLMGLLLILLMTFRPQGIIGDKREVAVSVRR